MVACSRQVRRVGSSDMLDHRRKLERVAIFVLIDPAQIVANNLCFLNQQDVKVAWSSLVEQLAPEAISAI